MTPVPLELPLRPAEATELANLIFDHAERKPLTDELRNRLAARAAALKLETITPHFGSLERDPIHPSAYYLAVDGHASPQLLYLALATAPTSSVFHKPLLIGRMRRLNGPEIVINAIPFGPADRDTVETFAARINPAFYPQPQGARSTITVQQDPPAAFALFRAILKRTGKNVAALAGDYHPALCAAIRAGWRAGYTIASDHLVEIYNAAYSRFCLTVPLTPAGLKAAEERHEQIRRARWGLKIARAFDFELTFDPPASADALRAALEQLREGVHTPQLVGGVALDELEEAAAVARQFQVTLTFTHQNQSAQAIQTIARATAGRFDYRVNSPSEAEFAAEHLF
ncbi:MAG: hypothetical protein JWP63_2772 [Candidatus Solibacter sp.]|nr:hypothetical protein [Candidatus Solibacter sp.]